MKELNLNDEIYMALVDCAEDWNDDLSKFKEDNNNDLIAQAISDLLEKRGFMLVQKDWNYENKTYSK
jgi:hypothetical protein